jgi:hypothetical protein
MNNLIKRSEYINAIIMEMAKASARIGRWRPKVGSWLPQAVPSRRQLHFSDYVELNAECLKWECENMSLLNQRKTYFMLQSPAEVHIPSATQQYSTPFMEPWGSLPCSLEPATAEPTLWASWIQSKPSHILALRPRYPSIDSQVSETFSFQLIRLKFSMHFSFLPCPKYLIHPE